MDFVVVGLGLGAVAILSGVLALVAVLPWQERSAHSGAAATHRENALALHRRGLARAFIYAGSAVLLATVGGLAGALDDQTGAYLVVTTATVAALGLLVWSYLDRARHPIPPPPPRARAGAEALAAAPVALPRAHPLRGHPPAWPNGQPAVRPAASRNGRGSLPATPLTKPLLAIAAHSVTSAPVAVGHDGEES